MSCRLQTSWRHHTFSDFIVFWCDLWVSYQWLMIMIATQLLVDNVICRFMPYKIHCLWNDTFRSCQQFSNPLGSKRLKIWLKWVKPSWAYEWFRWYSRNQCPSITIRNDVENSFFVLLIVVGFLHGRAMMRCAYLLWPIKNDTWH